MVTIHDTGSLDAGVYDNALRFREGNDPACEPTRKHLACNKEGDIIHSVESDGSNLKSGSNLKIHGEGGGTWTLVQRKKRKRRFPQ
jgi:hypothetical protein